MALMTAHMLNVWLVRGISLVWCSACSSHASLLRHDQMASSEAEEWAYWTCWTMRESNPSIVSRR